MKYQHLYADEAGESQMEGLSADLVPLVYAPPAPALEISAPVEATGLIYVRFPAGWDSELHPTPQRQLLIVLSGNLMGGLSDGTEFELTAGDIVLMEDTTGKGHTARTLNNQDVLAIMVHLE